MIRPRDGTGYGRYSQAPSQVPPTNRGAACHCDGSTGAAALHQFNNSPRLRTVSSEKTSSLFFLPVTKPFRFESTSCPTGPYLVSWTRGGRGGGVRRGTQRAPSHSNT